MEGDDDSFGGGQPKYTAADLIERALNALDSCEPMLAAKFFERALEIEPNNVDILDELRFFFFSFSFRFSFF